MKKLQNNFTTPEQSKRLLALGVPADSADCYYAPFIRGVRVRHEPYELRSTFFGEYPFNPCWSAGQLMEIMQICYNDTATMSCSLSKIDCNNLVEYMVQLLNCNVKLNHMDFSKLED